MTIYVIFEIRIFFVFVLLWGGIEARLVLDSFIFSTLFETQLTTLTTTTKLSCQSEYLKTPLGWEIASEEEMSELQIKEVFASSSWSDQGIAGLVMSNGNCYKVNSLESSDDNNGDALFAVKLLHSDALNRDSTRATETTTETTTGTEMRFKPRFCDCQILLRRVNSKSDLDISLSALSVVMEYEADGEREREKRRRLSGGVSCAAGYYVSSGVCAVCPKGSYNSFSASTATTCLPAPAGLCVCVCVYVCLITAVD